MWKLKEESLGANKKQNAIKIKEKLEKLQGEIEGLEHIEVGIDFLGGTNYDVVLYAKLLSREHLESYQNHPKHQAIVPFIKEVASDRKAVDYEL